MKLLQNIGDKERQELKIGTTVQRCNTVFVWKSIRIKNVNEEIIQAIQSIYKETYNKVRTCNILSKEFMTSEKVRQRSVLSPLLFICAMDETIRKCKKSMEKCMIGYRNLKPVYMEACAFADDIILFANSDKNLEKKLFDMGRNSDRYKLPIEH